VRFLERRAPPSERLALEREVLLPRVERVLLDFLTRFGDAGGEICVEVGTYVSRADVTAVDEDERGCPLRGTRREGAADPCPPGEPDKDGPIEAKLVQERRSQAREGGRPERLGRKRRRGSVPWWIGCDDAQSVAVGK
jgi:hypothetical protein